MSVATEITRLQTAKANLKTSIEAKGVTVSSSALLDAYPALVDAIPTGEKGYTEWPSALPTHEQMIQAAEEWRESIQEPSSNYLEYVIFKGNQIDDLYIINHNSSPITAYVYFNDTQTTESLTIPASSHAYFQLSNHTWADVNPYHWIFFTSPYTIKGLRNWNFFFCGDKQSNTSKHDLFNVDENGNVFAPPGRADLVSISTQLCDYSTWGDEFGKAGWKAPSKLPKLYRFSNVSGSYVSSETIKEIYMESGIIPTQNCTIAKPYAISKISADYWPLSSGTFNSFYNLRELDCSLTLIGTSLYQAFYSCNSLKNIPWPDTSSVTDMGYMFGNAKISDSSIFTGLDTSGATNMSYMFYNCWMREFPTLDYSSATNLNSIFREVRYATGDCTINAPNCTDLSNAVSYGNFVESIHINAPKCTLLNSAFSYCSGATVIDISSATTAKVTNFNSCFNGCSKITSLNAMNTSNVNVTNGYNNMFNNCTSLTTLGTEQVTDANGNTVNSWIFNYSVDLGYSPLNLASIKHVMENLKSGVSSQTFKLSKTSKQYLEAEPATDGTSANLYEQLVAEATTKGWTVSVNNSY